MSVGSLPVALGLGFCLGLRHAVDPDHVAAVAALAGGGRNSSAALVSSMAWGLGHSVTFLGCGLCVVALDFAPPPGFESSVAFGVAGTLVLIGLAAILRALRDRAGTRHVEDGQFLRRRSFAVGSVHGLAGSHGIALLALATIQGGEAALAYLVLFCIGTLLGMLGIALLLSRSLIWLESGGRHVTTSVGVLAGISSIWVGGSILYETLSFAR